jgi:hypothetical protein
MVIGWLQGLRAVRMRRRARPRSRPAPRARFLLEALESRLTPALFPALATQPFVLWEYADDVTSVVQTGITHWKDLAAFIAQNNITRVITDIKDPSHFPFFDVPASGGAPPFAAYGLPQ